jgi:DNA-binding NarL/FixJ family response regulator
MLNNFYVSIIFLGITLILISLVWIAYDKKKSDDYTKTLSEKKEELIEIISDADQMVEEMNKFSDYIATQMELKNEELCSNLKAVEDKLKQISVRVHESVDVKPIPVEKVVNGAPIGVYMKTKSAVFEQSSDLNIENQMFEHSNISPYNQNQRQQYKIKDNVIPLNGRHKEVLNLYENGLNETEIAKRLNMGKGEVQLILGVNKN